jgi:N-hydroxyarylamine O-acetyltransferase
VSYTRLSARELSDYFARIGFVGTAKADLATLHSLQLLHPLALAFENLDSWCGLAPSLNELKVFAKLVRGGRGGYCFEHNQLFMRVLLSVGFQVDGLAARVLIPDAVLPRTHHVLLVTLAGEHWLVDVGFGGMTMTAPLRLSTSEPQTTPHEPWRVQRLDEGYELSAWVQESWSAKYRFNLQTQTASDYEMANWYVATFPTSRFRSDLIAARVDHNGRHALLNNRYQQHRLGQTSVHTELKSAAEVTAVLQNIFGIDTTTISGLPQQLAKLFAAG